VPPGHRQIGLERFLGFITAEFSRRLLTESVDLVTRWDANPAQAVLA
jgi:hypothetical protein